jgi:hypothetical protein
MARRLPWCTFSLLSALLLVVGACAPPADIPYGTAGTGTPSGSSTGTGIDGGPAADGGPACVTDPDGTTATGLVVSEVGFGALGFLELLNAGSTAVDTGTLTVVLDGRSASPASGASQILPNERLLLPSLPIGSSGEVTLERGGAATFYVCWGTTGVSAAQNEALVAQVWFSPGVCPPTPASGESLHLASGHGTTSSEFAAGTPSPTRCE